MQLQTKLILIIFLIFFSALGVLYYLGAFDSLSSDYHQKQQDEFIKKQWEEHQAVRDFLNEE